MLSRTMNRARGCVGLALAVALAAGCSSEDAAPAGAGGGGGAGGGAAAVKYEAAGPAPVGHEVFSLEDAARGRTLTVQVWYPADEGARGGGGGGSAGGAGAGGAGPGFC